MGIDKEILSRDPTEAAQVRRWRVYIVECADGTYYTGISTDVAQRIQKHNSGKGAKYTRARRPVRLVTQSREMDHGEALKTERQIKRLYHWEKAEVVRLC